MSEISRALAAGVRQYYEDADAQGREVTAEERIELERAIEHAQRESNCAR